MMTKDVSAAIGLPKTANSYSEATSAAPIEPAYSVADTNTFDDLDIFDDIFMQYLTDIENIKSVANVSSQNVDLFFHTYEKKLFYRALHVKPQ